MSVKQESRGVYRVRVRAHGKQHERRFRGTKKEADAFERRWGLELEAKGPTKHLATTTFLDFCAGRYRIYAENHLKPTTWRNRQYQLRVLIQHFGGKRLDKFTNADIERFQNDRLREGVGAVKTNDDVKVLLAVLSYAGKQGLPSSDLKITRLPERGKRGRVKVWTNEEVQKLFKAFKKVAPELLPITVCMLNTGMRKGEALALKWDAVDLERGLLLIYPSEEWQPKNDKPREIPIGTALLPWLDRGYSKSEYVFPCSTGGRFVSWPQRRWDNARRASGVGGSPHVCRHTYASHFLQKERDLFLLASVLGHSHTRVTEIYSHLLPDHLERARNAVSFCPQFALILQSKGRK